MRRRPDPEPRPAVTRARRPLAATALVAAVVLTAVLALERTPAGAAVTPAKLAATPNPVVVPPGQTTGTYKLSWSTGDPGVTGELTVAVNNGAESPRLPVAASGSTNRSISIGQTHVVRLYLKGARTPSRVTSVWARPADQSCLAPCIKDVLVTPHGSYADVQVIASGPLKGYSLEASRDGQAVAGAAGPAGTQWTTALWHLTPATHYVYRLKVWDEAGNSQTHVETFDTLRPVVTVDVDSIGVGDDSDDLSEGEITWIFRAGDHWDPQSPLLTQVDSGDTFDPGYTTTVKPDTADLVIGLYGMDDDEGPSTSVDACGDAVWPEAYHDPGAGSNGCGEWATAYTAVPVLVDGVGEAFTAPFALGVSTDLISFVAHGTYTVTYEPVPVVPNP